MGKVKNTSFLVLCLSLLFPVVAMSMSQEKSEDVYESSLFYPYETHPQHQRLKTLLAHYQKYNDSCPKVSADCLKNGEGRDILVQNLKRHGFWQLGSGLMSTVEEALKLFQRSRGLKVTGTLTPETVALLNKPLSFWVGQINDSLRRLEKIKNFELRHVLVNIPSFTIYGYDGKKEAYQSPVVIGRKSTPTPELVGLITSFMTHPTWFVPRNLVEKLQESAGYRGYAWSDGRFIQRPGPHNNLGNIKFKVESPFENIIIHGTNKPHLFKKSWRASSHGCVRVQDTQGLLRFVMEGPEVAEASQALSLKKSKKFTLKRGVPLYITYLRVWVDNEGIPQFLPDVYAQGISHRESGEETDDDDDDDEET
jgi:murein L,D-transpeptidase YcbB/YkuD